MYDMMGADEIDALLGDDVDALLGGDDDDQLLGQLMGYAQPQQQDNDALLGAILLGRARRKAARRPPVQAPNQAMVQAIANARANAQQPQMLVRQTPPLLNRIPGVPGLSQQVLPLGFPRLTCTSLANQTGGNVVANPQKPWQGTKLIISISGLNSGNYSVDVLPVVGVQPVLASADSVDARSFPANALGNELMIESAGPGIQVSLSFNVNPTMTVVGDVVQALSTWMGKSIG